MWQNQLPALKKLIEALQAPKKGMFDMPNDPQKVERQKAGVYRTVKK